MNKIRINIINIVFFVMIIGVLLLFVSTFYVTKENLSGTAKVVIKVSENVSQLLPSVRPGEDVYLNGSNNVAKITDVKQSDSLLFVTITAPAEQEGIVYNFNGQRVLVGQKAELHGSFFARGTVESFNYEN